MLIEFFTILFDITLEIDGNFNRLNCETFFMYTKIYDQHIKRQNLKKWCEK